nr:D-xylose-proton symporter-like 3, chloroplastic isoform X1 [Ipomoea trifida]
MPKAKEGLSRPVDVAEVYRRRDIDGGGIVHLVRDDVIGRENIGRRPVRAGGSALHPRRPLQDITNMIDYSRIYQAYETRRERLREGEPGTPLLRDQTALNPTSPEFSGTTWFNLSAVQLGLVVSGSLYGALFGSLLVYPLADFLGRRRELIIAAILYALGGALTASASGLTVLLIGRLIYGLGIGLMGYFVGSYEINSVGGWRVMFGFSVPIAVLMGLGMLSLPPSPRWLLLRAVQGKGPLQEYKEKAISALSKLRGRPAGDKVSEKQIEDTLVSLKTAYTDEETEGSFLEVFQGPSLKAFIIGGGLVLFQQITGQPSVLYYAGPILQSAGFSAASDATRVSVIIGIFKQILSCVQDLPDKSTDKPLEVVSFLLKFFYTAYKIMEVHKFVMLLLFSLGFPWIAVLKVDDLGRRPLLIGGVSGIAVSLFLLSAYYKFLDGFPFVAVAALLLYVGCYQISFGPISWLMVSEIFPLRTRGKGISLAVLTNFGSNALVTFAFSPLKELLGAENLFLLFGAIALLSVVFVVTSVPETKGLSLEEIESKFLKMIFKSEFSISSFDFIGSSGGRHPQDLVRRLSAAGLHRGKSSLIVVDTWGRRKSQRSLQQRVENGSIPDSESG